MAIDTDNWAIPEYELIELKNRATKSCIVTAAWNEGEKSYAQYRSMHPYTKDFDFIVANRGDELPALGDNILNNDFNIRALLQLKAKGQSTAYRAALSFALKEGYESIVMIDSNGKDGVEALPAFFAELDAGFDFIQGSRYMPGGQHCNTPLVRTIAVRLVAPAILWLGCRYWWTDQTNGFKGFSRKFLLDPRVQPFRNIFVAHNLQIYLNHSAAIHKFRIKEVPVSRTYPATGAIPTKLNSLRQLIALFLDYIHAACGKFSPPKK